MLQCYFDDSGSHGNSRVVVWGGVVGTVEQFDELEARWIALLRNPMPDKPPLRMFHLTNCRSRWGEFSDYSYAESLAIQHDFRKIIVDCKLMPVAFAVDVVAWDRLVVGDLRNHLGDAERLAFGSCAKAALQIAKDDGLGMSIVFDKGRMLDRLKCMYRGA